jgi:hypothetical protein
MNETKPDKKSLAERLAFSNELIAEMLPAFPDHQKSTHQYVSALAATFVIYPDGIQKKLASIDCGLLAKHISLPSIADVRIMGDEFRYKNEFDGAELPIRVEVYQGTDAWKAWQRKYPLGTPCIDMRDKDGNPRRGWYFPTEFPKLEVLKGVTK